MKFQHHKRKTFLCFISRNVNAYLKLMKGYCLQWKNIVFSLKKNTISIFSLQQTEATSTIQGFISSRKDLECIVHVWHYATDVRTSNKSNWRHTLTSILSLRNANLNAMSVRRQLQADFLNFKFPFIYSLKWHDKPFSRCKPCLHPILDPLNALR